MIAHKFVFSKKLGREYCAGKCELAKQLNNAPV